MAAEAVLKTTWIMLLLLLLLLLLPFTSAGRQIPVPNYTFTSDSDSTFILDKESVGQYLMDHNLGVAFNEKGKQTSVEDINEKSLAVASTPARSGVNSLKKWGVWLVLLIFCVGGIGTTACCCCRDSTNQPAPSSPDPPTLNFHVATTLICNCLLPAHLNS